jgi:putative spermidine/putrescine transport system permease protein
MAGLSSAAGPLRGSRRGRIRWGRGAVLLVAGLYFAVPMLASVFFTVHVPGSSGWSVSAYTGLFSAGGFGSAMLLSLELAAATIVLVLLLMVPAMTAVRLGGPRLRAVVEVVCSLPLVVPAIALVAGIATVLKWGPDDLSRTPFYETFVAIQNPGFPVVLVLAYVVMALPFAFRSLDAGLRALDVHTLIEAARNCGAGPVRAVVSTVLPNLRGAILNTAFLTLALVLGEFTVAQILGYTPFSVWLVNGSDGGQAQVAVAASVLSLVVIWVLLLLVSVGAGRPRGKAAKELKP